MPTKTIQTLCYNTDMRTSGQACDMPQYWTQRLPKKSGYNAGCTPHSTANVSGSTLNFFQVVTAVIARSSSEITGGEVQKCCVIGMYSVIAVQACASAVST